MNMNFNTLGESSSSTPHGSPGHPGHPGAPGNPGGPGQPEGGQPAGQGGDFALNMSGEAYAAGRSKLGGVLLMVSLIIVGAGSL